jgi:hypothetical protein
MQSRIIVEELQMRSREMKAARTVQAFLPEQGKSPSS